MYRAAPSLSRQELHEILVNRATDNTATARIVGAMTRLVVRWASAYLSAGILPIDDLVQEGMLGLLHAIEIYDAERPSGSFHTLAWFSVRRQCSNAIRQNRRAVSIGLLRVDRNGLRGRVTRAERELRLLSGNATREEIAEHIGVAVDDVENVIFRYGTDLSLDAPLSFNNEESDLTLHTMIPSDAPPADELCDAHRALALYRETAEVIAENASPLERDVIYTRVLGAGDETVRTMGRRVGVSGGRIQQIDADVRNRLARHVRAQLEE